MYDALTDTLTAYDREILRQLDAMSRADSPDDPPPPPIARKPKGSKPAAKTRCAAPCTA